MKKIEFSKRKVITFLIGLVIIGVLVFVDQFTKYLANTNLKLGDDPVVFIKYIISFKLAYNKGAGFSILEGQKTLLISVSLIASIIELFITYVKIDFKKGKVISSSLILITAGTIGNLIDRAFYADGVIDFLNFEFMDFPIFNGADSMLTIGAVLLVYYVLFIIDKEEKLKNKDNNSGETNEL